MNFEINGRDIVQSHTQIGFQGDNNVEILEFRLPKWSSGEDLSQGVAILLYRLPDGSTGYMPMEMHTENESLVLVCKVSRQLTAQTGNVDVQLKISGLDEELWHSEITTFQIAKSLPVEGLPLVKMTLDGANAVLDDDPPITIAERKINIPANLQNIAVQNDQNSKTVTLQMPRYFDGHDLSKHSIYLKTVSDGGRDDVLFNNVTVGDTSLTFEWTLKPPQTSYNGKLNLQLYVMGTEFKWETEPASVNIIRSIDADPVIPMTPPIMDSFIQQLNAIKGQAEGYAQAAAGAAATATHQANIAKTEADRLVQAGANFKVLGFYLTLDALQAAVPNPARGDAYGVGDNPVHVYVWSGTEWQPGQALGIDLTTYYTKTDVDGKLARKASAEQGVKADNALTLGGRIGLKNVDLDDIKTVGSYAVKSNDDAQTVMNRPFNSAFNIDIGYPTGSFDPNGYISQTAIEYETRRIKSRTFNPWNSGRTWGEWREYSMGETLTVDKNIYVRKTGNDSTGDGSTERPFLTIGKAVDYTNKQFHGNVMLSIIIGDGTYEETPIILVASNLRIVRVMSESSNLNNVYIKINGNGQFLVHSCNAEFYNITFSSNLPDYCNFIRFDYSKGYTHNCKFIQTGGSNTASYAISADNSSQIFAYSCIVENTVNAFFSARSSTLNCVNVSGYCRGTGYVADGGVIMYGSSTLTSSTVKAEGNGGQVRP